MITLSNPLGFLKVLQHSKSCKKSIPTTLLPFKRVVQIDFPGWRDFWRSKVPKKPWAREVVQTFRSVDVGHRNHWSSVWYLGYFWRPEIASPRKIESDYPFPIRKDSRIRRFRGDYGQVGGTILGGTTLPPLETTAVRTVGKGKGKGKVQDSTPGFFSFITGAPPEGTEKKHFFQKYFFFQKNLFLSRTSFRFR